MIQEKSCLILENFGVKVIIIKDYPKNSDKDALMFARMLIENAESE